MVVDLWDDLVLPRGIRSAWDGTVHAGRAAHGA
jgi:hypothetical protein